MQIKCGKKDTLVSCKLKDSFSLLTNKPFNTIQCIIHCGLVNDIKVINFKLEWYLLTKGFCDEKICIDIIYFK